MSDERPAICLTPIPGRIQLAVTLAQQFEQRGFSGIFVPNVADPLGFCAVLALQTRTIRLATAISDISLRHPWDYAHAAALVHELSGGRFWFGIGVGHERGHAALGIPPGRPLADVRSFVRTLRAAVLPHETLPPVALAALRRRMVALAGEIGDGVIWAHGARSHMKDSLMQVRPARRTSARFLITNIALTCIAPDREAAAHRLRLALCSYATLPNYQNYWIEAGYENEVADMQRLIARGNLQRLPEVMSDRWLNDIALYGSPADIRGGIEAWQAAGVRTVALAPVSVQGGTLQALREVLDTFGR